jgi:hypothetical protein
MHGDVHRLPLPDRAERRVLDPRVHLPFMSSWYSVLLIAPRREDPMVIEGEGHHLERVRQDLLRAYPTRDPEQLNACFAAVVAGFAAAPVRTFVPVLVGRRCRQELSDGCC